MACGPGFEKMASRNFPRILSMSVEIFKKIMELNKSVGFESEPNFLFSCRRPLVLRSFILSIVYFSILLKAGEEKQSR